MQSGFYKLTSNDFIKGAVVAIGAAIFTSVIAVLDSVINTPNFDVFAVDWGTVLHMVINVAIVSGFGGFTGYLGKNFLSDSNGAVFGSIGGGGK